MTQDSQAVMRRRESVFRVSSIPVSLECSEAKIYKRIGEDEKLALMASNSNLSQKKLRTYFLPPKPEVDEIDEDDDASDRIREVHHKNSKRFYDKDVCEHCFDDSILIL